MSEATRDTVDDDTLRHLAALAWDARNKAFVIGPTKVGCAVLADAPQHGGPGVQARTNSRSRKGPRSLSQPGWLHVSPLAGTRTISATAMSAPATPSTSLSQASRAVAGTDASPRCGNTAS